VSRFEADLARALRRRDPPRGLEQGIWARIPRHVEPAVRPRPWLRGALAAAALVVVSFVAGVAYERQARAQRNEAARQQVALTLAVATEQIERAESKAFTVAAWGRLRDRLDRLPQASQAAQSETPPISEHPRI
jgi:hypothetical protein